jgi:hypothetical protein
MGLILSLKTFSLALVLYNDPLFGPKAWYTQYLCRWSSFW